MDATFQEVAESRFYKWNEIPPFIQRKLKRSFCINCERKLSGQVNYVITSKNRVLWWHNICPDTSPVA
ncbi:hypothetical protein M0R04_14030 [Candidatus Dojkabacteria bacterium]|jgi:RNase P subunit RPR2|nr:hypothetical protein [Candidatus Dojkabacteria bacterium]